MRQFADRHRVQFFVQPRGPDTAMPFYPPHDGVLYYRLPEFDLELGFSPTEFTQVNAAVNAVLVRRAMALLEPQAGERIADMFCGLGNFTLAIARSGASVLGVEGERALVARAQSNAARNGLSAAAEFRQADLFKLDGASLAQLGRFDRMLIDPPRDGAVALIKALSDDAPRRIVYVSCNAATLARDAGVLVHVQRLRADRGGRGQHVSAHLARRIDRGVRSGNEPAQWIGSKKRASADALFQVRGLSSSVAIPRERHQQLQQTGEQVVNAHVERQRRRDVIGFAAAARSG